MAVKILLDPSMYHPNLSVADEVRKAAALGYKYLELSPRPDFHEWHHYPKVDDAQVADVKAAMKETGVKIWTFNPVYNWACPEEPMREHAVRCIRRLLEVMNDLEVPVYATEFSGDPNRPIESEAAFYKSMEELVPDFERHGIECVVEAHPYDFVEVNDRAVQIVRGVNKDWFNYQFCFPHMFHLSGGNNDVRSLLEYAGPRLAHLHIADVYNHLANVGNRYIINPPGADARVHQHNEIGNGEVPWDEAFDYLRETGYDKAVSVCVFGWEEDADAIHVRMRERIEKELGSQ
ncbi:MAG: sugar phosphate isomerase/epimerase family protein [Dermatophilus congolensis]|nr:sugar phosphate isomerase/epimerase family protein [Dermatophilus congolensis]